MADETLNREFYQMVEAYTADLLPSEDAKSIPQNPPPTASTAKLRKFILLSDEVMIYGIAYNNLVALRDSIESCTKKEWIFTHHLEEFRKKREDLNGQYNQMMDELGSLPQLTVTCMTEALLANELIHPCGQIVVHSSTASEDKDKIRELGNAQIVFEGEQGKENKNKMMQMAVQENQEEEK